MNRGLQLINLLGVLLLAALCVVQWQVNRRTNLRAIELDRIGQDQRTKISEQEKTIKGQTADLDSFREQLTRTHTTLKETETRLATVEGEVRQLTNEREQLKASITNWVAAVTARDEQLKTANVELQKLGNERNEVVGKFNELAAKYNSVVKDLNEERARQSTNTARSNPPK